MTPHAVPSTVPPPLPVGRYVWIATCVLFVAGVTFVWWRQETRLSALKASDEARAKGELDESLRKLEPWFASHALPGDPVRVRVALTRRKIGERLLARTEYEPARAELARALVVAVDGCLERPAVEETQRAVDRAEAANFETRKEWQQAAALQFRGDDPRRAYSALARGSLWTELLAAARERKEFHLAAPVLRDRGRTADAATLWEEGSRWREAAAAWTKAGDPARSRAAWRRALELQAESRDFAGLNVLVAEIGDAAMRQELAREMRPQFKEAQDLQPLAEFFTAAGAHPEAAGVFEQRGDWRAATESWEKARRPDEVRRLLRAAVTKENDSALTLRAARACEPNDQTGRNELLALALQQAEAKDAPQEIAAVYRERGEIFAGARRLVDQADELRKTRPREAADWMNAAKEILPEFSTTRAEREFFRRVEEVSRAVESAVRLAPTVHHRDSKLSHRFDKQKRFERSVGTVIVLNPAPRRIESLRIEVEMWDTPPTEDAPSEPKHHETVTVRDVPASGEKIVELALKNPRPFPYWRTQIVEVAYAP